MLPLSAHDAIVCDDIMGSKITDDTMEKEHTGKSVEAYSFHVVSVPLRESAKRS
jgi:hypothetical protein